MDFAPTKCIFPIVQFDSSNKPKEFIGTGFFIDSKKTILTAKHVFKDNPLSKGENYRIASLDTNPILTYEIRDILFSKEFDIAKGTVENIAEIVFPIIPSNAFPPNSDVLTQEYSDSGKIQFSDGATSINLISTMRKGYVSKTYISNIPEKVETLCLELSFPAFKGASGAPVIVEGTWELVGMIVANIEKDLLPAHILKIQDEMRYSEEHSYFLPVGKAIHWKHLKDFVEGKIKLIPEVKI